MSDRKDEAVRLGAEGAAKAVIVQGVWGMKNKLIESNNPPLVPKDLLGDIRRLIEETRSAVARTGNTGLTMLYCRIGKRINEEILKDNRADYGKQILATLSQELTRNYRKGFSYSSLTRRVSFAQAFPDGRQKLKSPPSEIVGIDVKTIKSGDFKGLNYLSELLGDRFLRGIVLYTGDQPAPSDSNLYTLPVSKLWRTGEVPHKMSKDKAPKIRKMGIRAKLRLLPKMPRTNAEEAASHD